MKRKDILTTLDELRENEFIRFKWFLQDEGFTMSDLEKAENREQTVTLMVKTKSIPEAIELTKKLLKEICRNDLVQSLSETISGQEGQ